MTSAPAFLPAPPLGLRLAPALAPRARLASSPRRPRHARRAPAACDAGAAGNGDGGGEEADVRETDARGFVLPRAGDVVLYQGRWPGEDEAGLVESIRFVEARRAHVVDVAPLRRVSLDLFAVPRARRRSSPRWFDVAEVRVVSDATYVPRQDAYRVAGTSDGYAPVAAPSPEQRAEANAEYRALQRDMLRTTALAAAAGTVLAGVLGGLDVARAAGLGGAASMLYLYMLQRAVDNVGAQDDEEDDGVPAPLRALLPLRFAVPALPFALTAAPRVPLADFPAALLGSVSRAEALAIVLGLLTYKVPLLLRTSGEFVDGVADLEPGKTGMVGTAASLVARQVRKRRDGTDGAPQDDDDDDARARTKRPVLVFAGPSGAGKSTLLARILDELPGRFAYNVSHTTRDMREGERDGVDYNFVTADEFERMVDAGEFVEHARVHGRCYGTAVQAVEKVAEDGQVCLLDLDVQGVETLRAKTGLEWDARYVWIAPPSVDALRARLVARGSETDETLKRRLETAVREMSFAATNDVFDIIIVNDDLDKAYGELRAFVDRACREWGWGDPSEQDSA